MKIAFVALPGDWVIPPYQKSAGIWIHEIATRVARNHEVWIYAWRHPLPPNAVEPGGIHYRLFRSRLDRPFDVVMRRLQSLRGAKKPFFASPLCNPGYEAALIRDLARRSFDVVHATEDFALPLYLKALRLRPRIAFHTHAEWLTLLDRAMMERRIRSSDLILGCSRYITDSVRRRFPQYADRCHTIYNGVDPGRFVPADRGSGHPAASRRVLFVGRVSPEKGLHILLEAFQIVARECPESRLQILGQLGSAPPEFIVAPAEDPQVASLTRFYAAGSRSGYYRHLLALARQLGIQDRVDFWGQRPYPEVVGFYQGADLVVNPSFCESFGRSLIEGMACGVPVVATRVGGVPEIVDDGRTGVLVERGDPGALSEAMLHILSDPERGRSLGLAGRRRVVERFSWDLIAQEFEQCLGGISS